MVKFKTKGISEDTIITTDNIQDIAEITAISAVKKMISITGNPLKELYRNLCHDIFTDHLQNETISDSYDIVQEVVVLLCTNVGRKLGEYSRTDRRGKRIDIWTDCYRTVYNYINDGIEMKNLINSLEEADQYRYVMIEECGDTDYTMADRIIEEMHLTPKLEETLNCQLAGYRFVDMMKEFGIVRSALFERKERLKKRYLEAVAILNYNT